MMLSVFYARICAVSKGIRLQFWLLQTGIKNFGGIVLCPRYPPTSRQKNIPQFPEARVGMLIATYGFPIFHPKYAFITFLHKNVSCRPAEWYYKQEPVCGIVAINYQFSLLLLSCRNYCLPVQRNSLGSGSPINPLIEIADPLLSLPRTICVIPALVEWLFPTMVYLNSSVLYPPTG